MAMRRRRRQRGLGRRMVVAGQVAGDVRDEGAVLGRVGVEGGALERRPLVGEPQDAVAAHVQDPAAHQLHAVVPHRVEEVVRQRQVPELPRLGQQAHYVGDLPVQLVPGEVQLLHVAQAPERQRDGAGDLVAAGVEHGQPLHQPDLVGEAPRQPVVEEQHLRQRRRGVVDGPRDRAGELVVGHDQVLGACAPEAVRDAPVEAVVVEEQRLHGEREHRRRHRAGVPVEAEVEEEEPAEGHHGIRERAGEVVVGEVELVEEGQVGEVRDVAGEVVGVGVEQGQIRELVDEPGQRRRAQAEAVEVDGRHGERGVRARREVAVEALVLGAVEVAAAEVGALPRRRHAQRVARDRLLERLDHRPQRLQLLVQELPRRRPRPAPAPCQRPRRRRRQGTIRARDVPAGRPQGRRIAAARDDTGGELDVARAAESTVRRGEHEHDYHRGMSRHRDGHRGPRHVSWKQWGCLLFQRRVADTV
jgi:hypothetical protein